MANSERFMTQVPCPRGRECGSTCFLSEETRDRPSFLRRAVDAQMNNETILDRILVESTFIFTDATYRTYQCPACGARVVFAEYNHSDGSHAIKRIYAES